jgi:hypothetical protein
MVSSGIVPDILKKHYLSLKKTAGAKLLSHEVTQTLSAMAGRARYLLASAETVELTSAVPHKRYFAFKRSAIVSRPINRDLYVADEARYTDLLKSFDNGFKNATPDEIGAATYTMAFAVLAANDIYDVGRKASATFFEVLIGHIFARALQIEPRKKIRIPESGADLPTDYVFDPGLNRRKMHLPIKTSTRERAVQAWVHQLVLERIFGNGQFRGLFVVGAETKRDSKKDVVIEICVPKQLQMFQSRVAEITRIYYLDPPQVYLALAAPGAMTRISVKPFGEALAELSDLLNA